MGEDSARRRLEGKVAVITGGASGIGLAIARRYVAEGARVVLGDLNVDALKTVEEELGDPAAAIAVDVRNEVQVAQMVALARERYGGLDIAVNSAGLGTYAPIVDQTEEQWDQIIDVCLKGVFLCMKHEAREICAGGGGGVILNIASLNAYQPGEGMSAYCTAKAGVEMLSRVGAMELGAQGVRVCGIAPGLIDTPLTAPLSAVPQVRDAYLENIPLGRAGTPTDISDVAVFLASDEASWISGTTVQVDGASNTKRYPEFMKIFGALGATS